MVRQEGSRPTNTIWIFCEGEKTEKNYFRKLKIRRRISRFNVQVIPSENRDAVGIVGYTKKTKEKNPADYKPGDLIYCVFDRDANKNNALEKAKSLAKNKGFQIIFSNPCFEYWILCHYEYYSSRCTSDELTKRIKNKHIKDYRKNDTEIYDKTAERIQTAINNSRKIAEKHSSKRIPLISEESNPSTQVYKLIEKLKAETEP